MSSKAQATRNIRFIQNAGTVVCWLECSTGDLYQFYQGNANDNEVSPAISSSNPVVVTLRAFDTTTGREFDFASGSYEVEWHLGSPNEADRIPFNDGGLSIQKDPRPWGGLFRRQGNRLYVMGNLAFALGKLSSTLFCRATLSNGISTFHPVVSIPVTISKVVENSWNCSVYGDPGLSVTSKVASDPGGTVTLRAHVFRGLAEVTTAVLYWQVWRDSGWVYKGQSQSLALTADDIDSSLYVRCSVKEKASDANYVCFDTATAYDESDPLLINPNPSPADETIYEGDDERSQVTYTPRLCRREGDDGTGVAQPSQYEFELFDPAGVNMTGSTDDTGKSFTVTAGHCAQAGGDVTLVISCNV